MIAQSKAEIRMAKAGFPGTLTIPAEVGYVGELGDKIEIKGADPDNPGLLRLWRGHITKKDEASVVLTGRYWIGNERALATL